MAIVKPTKQNIQRAAREIQNHGVVAFPTETVYGLGANAFDALAVAKIFEIKNRPQFDPLIVHIADMRDVEKVCNEFPEQAQKLAHAFWPGPLTLVVQKSEHIPGIVTAGLRTVGVRMPDHRVALDLIRQSGVPIAAPSANPFGYLSPTTAEHVSKQIGNKVDAILDGGPCAIGVESTIVAAYEKELRVLRVGGLPLEDIERVIGKVAVTTQSASQPEAPGQLSKHYAPKTNLVIISWEIADEMFETGKRIGLLAFGKPKYTQSFTHIEILSEKCDIKQAASRLFECLHRLDEAKLDVIYAQAVPEIGLGLAIMDRLRRASFRDTV